MISRGYTWPVFQHESRGPKWNVTLSTMMRKRRMTNPSDKTSDKEAWLESFNLNEKSLHCQCVGDWQRAFEAGRKDQEAQTKLEKDCIGLAYQNEIESLKERVSGLVEVLQNIMDKTICDPAGEIELRARAEIVYNLARVALRKLEAGNDIRKEL